MKDDTLYISLIERYKAARSSGVGFLEASKYLDKATKIAKDGEVSEEVILGAAYL